MIERETQTLLFQIDNYIEREGRAAAVTARSNHDAVPNQRQRNEPARFECAQDG